MPKARETLEAGELSMSSAEVLAWAREADPEGFEVAEPSLVGAARTHSVKDLARICALWRDAVEAEQGLGGLADDRRLARRRLHASATLDGMVRVDADLDPEAGEGLLKDPWAHSRATPELEHTGPIPAELARRLACDASVMRVVMSASSEPLDLGRRTPVVPPGMRRAVVLRDRHCRFPGCDRPAPWSDAHHVLHWAKGGATALSNLVLLCRRHHRMVHAGFGLQLADGRAVFRRPDGSVLEDRAPP